MDILQMKQTTYKNSRYTDMKVATETSVYAKLVSTKCEEYISTADAATFNKTGSEIWFTK